LLILFRLAACLAAFRSRIATFLEERLIFAGKSEILPAIAAGHLLISHKTLSLVRSQLADICRDIPWPTALFSGGFSNGGRIAH
jgi:hypothetical protein